MLIIRNYTKEAGVRELERVIATLFRKIVKKILLEKDTPFYNITEGVVEEFLNKKKYLYTETTEKNEVGVVNGMAYTIFGGDILPVESTLYKGKGDLTITGSLGDVMQESCHIALSYIKANMKEFQISEKIIEENDVHIHVPEGAVNKDGPSAGVTITTSLISLLTNKAVDKNIAMTGEITRRGRVLAIGGQKEKIIDAHREGIKKIFIKKENEKDLEEIPKNVKDKIKFVFVKNYKDIYQELFKVSKKHGI